MMPSAYAPNYFVLCGCFYCVRDIWGHIAWKSSKSRRDFIKYRRDFNESRRNFIKFRRDFNFAPIRADRELSPNAPFARSKETFTCTPFSSDFCVGIVEKSTAQQELSIIWSLWPHLFYIFISAFPTTFPVHGRSCRNRAVAGRRGHGGSRG